MWYEGILKEKHVRVIEDIAQLQKHTKSIHSNMIDTTGVFSPPKFMHFLECNRFNNKVENILAFLLW